MTTPLRAITPRDQNPSGDAIQVRRVTRTFPGGAGIHDIAFTAKDRAVTAVIGPNGAGKTVLFSIIAGLLPADSGQVTFGPGRSRVAYCPDVPQFEPWLTALEVVETSLAIARMRRTVTARESLGLCGLGKVATRRVADFSRGMLQRLGIAAAIVLDPDVLILDEPNSALDPIGRADIRALITEQKQHRCIVLSSHMLSEVEQLADDVVVISDGRMIAHGTTTEILTGGLEPVWTIRLGAPTATTTETLVAEVPHMHLEFVTDTLCTARFTSFDTAATELTHALTLLGAPVIEVTLQDRDLDATFARIIQRQER